VVEAARLVNGSRMRQSVLSDRRIALMRLLGYRLSRAGDKPREVPELSFERGCLVHFVLLTSRSRTQELDP
jgi:hypothetical protein